MTYDFRKLVGLSVLFLTVLSLGGCTLASERVTKTQVGKASYYGSSLQGHITASGEKLNIYALTAAHRTLPFNTRVKVTLLSTKKSVIVRINDRGPFTKGRIIDLSDEAARRIGLISVGVGTVKLEVLSR